MAQVLKFRRNSVDLNLLVTPEAKDDETGASWGPANHGLSLADSVAFFNASGVDLSGFAGTEGSNTPYVLFLKDSSTKLAWGYVGAADAAEALGAELLSNIGFETAGAGGADIWADWLEAAGDGALANEVVIVHGGADSCKTTAGPSANARIYQGVTVVPGKLYKITFYTYGDGTYDGRYQVRDNSNHVDIIATTATGQTAAAWAAVTVYVTAPSGCTSIILYLRCPSTDTGIAYFDDTTFKNVTDVGATGLHIVNQRNGSVRNWASIESGFDYNDSAYTFGIYESGWSLVIPPDGTGYIPKVADIVHGRAPLPVNDVMELECLAQNQDHLAAEMVWLKKLASYADSYIRDRTEQHPVWLHASLDAETGERRALVRKIKIEQGTQHYGPGAKGNIISAKAFVQLGIERGGAWERTATRDLPVATPAALGFDSGSTEPTVGETVTGNASGWTGLLSGYHVVSGTWGGGNAAGALYFSDTDGAFQNNEALNGSISGNDFATADGVRMGAASLVYDYTQAGSAVAAHDIVGDALARIQFLNIAPVSVGDEISRLWIGIRSVKKHKATGLSNFITIWECEAGTLGTDAALAADATASPGVVGNTKVTITPGTATWAKRLSIDLQDVTANFEDNFGRFLWLLRTKVSAGKWDVQLRFGYGTMAAADLIQGPILSISSTSWNTLEMDESIIPLRDLHSFPLSVLPGSENFCQVQIWARRTSGAGTLDLDCLKPIPVDEGWLKSSGFTMTVVALGADQWYFGESPEQARQCLTYGLTGAISAFKYFAALEAPNFRLPPGDGRMVIVHARASSSVLADRIGLNSSDVGKYYESWYTLRGTE